MGKIKLKEKIKHVKNELHELAGLLESELKEFDNIMEENMENGYPEKDSRDPAYLTPWMQEKVKQMIERYNLENSPKKAIITCTFRNPEYQKKLYRKGRLGDKIIFPRMVVTGCDGYKKVSNHNVIPAQAVDTAIILNGKCLWDLEYFLSLGEIGERLGLVWGHRFKVSNNKTDYPHFEQPKGVV